MPHLAATSRPDPQSTLNYLKAALAASAASAQSKNNVGGH
jgi:hypothetical protein